MRSQGKPGGAPKPGGPGGIQEEPGRARRSQGEPIMSEPALQPLCCRFRMTFAHVPSQAKCCLGISSPLRLPPGARLKQV